MPPGVFNVVHGFGETAGAALSAHPGVNLICFTGETTTGQTIIAAGAPTLKRSSIELGGKSPVVVFEDADPELCVDAALAQIFTMNGQRCTAGSRLLVQEDLYEELVGAVAERAKKIRVGDPTDPNTELGPLIRPEHHARVLDYIDSAREQGARVLAGGERPAELPDGNFLQATVIADVDEHMKVFPGGDLRAGAGGDAVLRRGRRDPSGQRDPVRARRLRVDQRHPPRASRRARDRYRHVLDQLPERA